MWLAIKEFTEGFWIEHPDIIIGPRPDPLNVPFGKHQDGPNFVFCAALSIN